MDIAEQLSALIDLATSLGIEIRPAPPGMESSEHPGGAVVRLRGKEIAFLASEASAADQSAVLAAALANRKELQDRFLPPTLRELLEREQ